MFSSIAITNYRNLASISMNPGLGINFVIGPNGVGKTNLLDAFYYNSMTKSYFTASDKLICRDGQEFFRLYSEVINVTDHHHLEIRVIPGKSKTLIWDGLSQTKASEHIGRVPVVMISPDDVFKLVDSQDSRREFLNQALVQIDKLYLDALTQYSKILKQKLALVKNKHISLSKAEQLLDVYDQQLEKPAIYIAQSRSNFVSNLNPILDKLSLEFSEQKQSSSLEHETHSMDGIFELWKSSRKKDIESGRIQYGTHRDKVKFNFNGHSLREYGSQGQIKTFILALRIAQYLYLKDFCKVKPVLLLDDLFAKLDMKRVEALLQYLVEHISGQCFVSDNYLDRAMFLKNEMANEAEIFLLENNILRPYEKSA